MHSTFLYTFINFLNTKVGEAKKTSFEIDKARELYRPAAARASVLYFILNDLYKINPIYQFSLKAFSVVFHVAIERATQAEDVRIRVANLTDCITHSVFMYTTRGLFECDKLIFTAQMAFQVSFNRNNCLAACALRSNKQKLICK